LIFEGEAKPNRFADKMANGQLMVLLDADVAAVFKSPEAVNRVLRILIQTMPQPLLDQHRE
jgi:hypothetical protein